MVINGVKFEIAPNSNLRLANLRENDLSRGDLRSANLQDANLQGANLRGADLWYANLSGANLSNADLRLADLRSANLSGTDLRGANLRDANLPYPIIQMGPGGSRKDYVVFKTGIDEVMTGCFRGTLEEFTERVHKTYPTGHHRHWYDVVITVFKSMK